MTCSKLAVILVVLLAATVFVSAQSAPDLENGFKAYGSYDGSNLDSVNIENGNLMLHSRAASRGCGGLHGVDR